MKVLMCMNCGWIFDQAAGDAESGIAPGTAWEDVPDDWKCPDCNAGKSDFDMVEV
jgi:rubredoxin